VKSFGGAQGQPFVSKNINQCFAENNDLWQKSSSVVDLKCVSVKQKKVMSDR
jgi:hypothetical protein